MEMVTDFNLYSTCIPVKGHLRSIIYDLDRNRYDFIPNALHDLIVADNSQKEEIIEEIPDDILKEYEDFLLKKDYLLRAGSLTKYFPKLSMEWDVPSIISNCLVELSSSLVDFDKAGKELNKLGCHYYQVILVEKLSASQLMQFLRCFKSSNIKEIQLLLDFDFFDDEQFIQEIPLEFPFCNRILVFNSLVSKLIERDYYEIKYVPGQVRQVSGNPNLFGVNIKLFTESQHFNTYFNRKLIIDRNGKIVPYLGSKEFFGTIYQNLDSAIQHKDFKKFWEIKKDDIRICQDCEFRYMCVDARKPILLEEENTSDLYDLQNSCTYDPYTAKWSEATQL